MNYRLKNGKQITLGNQVGQGGEGAVYEILGQVDTLAKIYKKDKAPDRKEKVEALADGGYHKRLQFGSFPIDCLYESSGAFAGFTMRRVKHAHPVHQFYNRKDRHALYPNADYRMLVRAAQNLAEAFAKLHYEKMVVGDVNESGVWFTTQGWVKLIDCDSFQVEVGSKKYRCLVKVPQYTAPELMTKTSKTRNRTENHDNFALAIMVFRLLMAGLHPFTAKHLGSGDSPNEQKRIKLFEYPYHRNNPKTVYAPPPLAPDISGLPDEIITAFEKAFSLEGTKKRPTANDWSQLLQNFDQSLADCSADQSHQYYSVLSTCPHCQYESKIGAKLFAAKQNRTSSSTASPRPFQPSNNNSTLQTLNLGRIAKYAIGLVLLIAGFQFIDFGQLNKVWNEPAPQATQVKEEIIAEQQAKPALPLRKHGQPWSHLQEIKAETKLEANEVERVFETKAGVNFVPLDNGGFALIQSRYDFEFEDENAFRSTLLAPVYFAKFDKNASIVEQDELDIEYREIDIFHAISENLFYIRTSKDTQFIYNSKTRKLKQPIYYSRRPIAIYLRPDGKFIDMFYAMANMDEENVCATLIVVMSTHDVDNNYKHIRGSKLWDTFVCGGISKASDIWNAPHNYGVRVKPNPDGGYLLWLSDSAQSAKYQNILYNVDYNMNKTNGWTINTATKENERNTIVDFLVSDDGTATFFVNREYGDSERKLNQIVQSTTSSYRDRKPLQTKVIGYGYNNNSEKKVQGIKLVKMRKFKKNYLLTYTDDLSFSNQSLQWIIAPTEERSRKGLNQKIHIFEHFHFNKWYRNNTVKIQKDNHLWMVNKTKYKLTLSKIIDFDKITQSCKLFC